MPPPYTVKTTATEVAADCSASIRGKTVLTTGVTPNGLGAQFVTAIAHHSPALLILLSRSQASIDATTAAIHAVDKDISVRGVIVDLGSLASVRAAAAELTSTPNAPPIDVLMLNAGIMACPYELSPDGYESHLATNHLGHFVLANTLLKPMLSAGHKPRVVVISSEGNHLSPIRFADPGFEKGTRYNKWRGYGQSKTANCLYALALAERLGDKGVLAFSVHPGPIPETNLGKHIDGSQGLMGPDYIDCFDVFASNGQPQGNVSYWAEKHMKSLDEGAATHIVAAFADGLEGDNGRFLIDSQVASPDQVAVWARDSYDANRLWKMSEEMVGEKFDF